MLLQQLSLFVENKAGRFAEITQALYEANVDIRALSVADTTDFGVLRLIVNDPLRAVEALRAHGMTASLTEVIALGMDDRPGGLNAALKVLADAGIDVEYMYAFISREENRAYVILRVEDNGEAVRVLEAQNMHLLDGTKLYEMS